VSGQHLFHEELALFLDGVWITHTYAVLETRAPHQDEVVEMAGIPGHQIELQGHFSGPR
jgi:hypothetical protein